jgi:hypothetical protein
MEYMVMYILDDPVLMEDLIETWVAGGIRGATIIESTGMYRLQRKLIPTQYLFSSNKTGEKDNITIMAIVKDQATAEKCLEITESIVGDLDHPNTGIFAAWPLGIVKGLHARGSGEHL